MADLVQTQNYGATRARGPTVSYEEIERTARDLMAKGERRIGQFRGQVVEGQRIASADRGLVFPEALHAGGDVIRGAAAERPSYAIDGRSFPICHERTGRAFNFLVRDGRAAHAGRAVVLILHGVRHAVQDNTMIR